jgi:hypothetical protein
MTFGQWLTGKTLGSMELQFAKSAWEAATLAERQRCADVAEAAASDDNKYDIADAIRYNTLTAMEK